MKRFVQTAFFTILAGIGFYCGIVWLSIVFSFNHWLPNFYSTAGGYGQMLLRIREVKKAGDIDILFIGSSHTYRGFDPREFEKRGFSSFNLGSSSQTPFNSYYLLREYLPKLTPEVVVLDLYWNMLAQEGIESTIDIVSNSEFRSGAAEMAAFTKDGQAYTSILTNIIRRLHTPLHELKQEDNKIDLYVPGGFTQSLHEGNTINEKELMDMEKAEVEFSERQLNHVYKIIELCQENSIQLVFVVTPVTPYYKETLLNYDEYSATITAIANKHNIPLFDYNTRDDLDLQPFVHFYDEDHLTQAGVIIFNEAFIRDLDSKAIVDISEESTKNIMN